MGAPSKSSSSRALINIDVPELQPAIDFYEAAVGMQLERVLDDDVAELTYGSSIIYLLCKADGSGATPGIATSAVLRVTGRPCTSTSSSTTSTKPWPARPPQAPSAKASVSIGGAPKCVTFSDPFGHGFCLIEFAGDRYE